MTEFLNYLNSPHLVANFQKVFGIESKFDDSGIDIKHFKYVDLPLPPPATTTTHSNSKPIVIKPVKSNIISKNNNISHNNNIIQTRSRSNNIQNSNSIGSTTTTITINKENTSTLLNQTFIPTKNKEKTTNGENGELKKAKKLVNKTDDKNIIANTTIHIKFWYYFFKLGAAMGNEIFYCLFFPFWFWNVDGAIARKVGFLWGIYMTVGQATKDLLRMPRPASPPVVKLEERYLAEFGFPSTHAMVNKMFCLLGVLA